MQSRDRHGFRVLLSIVLVSILLAGCDDDGGGGGSTAAPPTTASETIGPAGGTVTSGDGRLTLTFPPGALPAENTITIETTDPGNPPSEFQGIEVDNSYDLRPDGLSFDQPVTASFNIGGDPQQDDDSLALPLALLLTAANGAPVALDDLTLGVDPDTGLTRVSGALSHFSPIVFSQSRALTYDDRINSPTFVVINGVPDSLPADQTFTAQVIVTVDLENSEFDAVGDVMYGDASTDPPPLTDPDPERRDIPRDGPAFVTEIQYGCTEPGRGLFGAVIWLNGVRYDFEQGTATERRYIVGLFADQITKQVTCTAPDDGGGGGGETALLMPAAGNPGPGSFTASPFAPADVSLDLGEEMPPYLVAVMDGEGSLRFYDNELRWRDSKFIGQGFSFASATLDYAFTDSGGAPQRRQGVVLGGENGAVFVNQATNGAFTMTQTLEPEGNVTDAVAYNGGRNAALVNFSMATVTFYEPGPDGVLTRDEANSGLISLDTLDDNAPVSVYVPPTGFDDIGDFVLVATNSNVATENTAGKLYGCARTEAAGQPAADCNEVADFGEGSDTLRVRAAAPDADGDTVVAVSNFGAQTIALGRLNIFDGSMTMIEPIENAQTVSPAVMRDGDEVAVVATDADEDMLVAAKLRPGDTTASVQRAPTPEQPSANDPQGTPVKARTPVHVTVDPILAALQLFIVTEGRDALAHDAGTLLLGALLSLGVERVNLQ